MDGRGRWMDNVFIERLWRTLKYEDIYLKGYADGREAKAGIASWVRFYNGEGFIRRSATARRWRSGWASLNRSGPQLWTCRFAWTTQGRCPHAHSPSSNSREE